MRVRGTRLQTNFIEQNFQCVRTYAVNLFYYIEHPMVNAAAELSQWSKESLVLWDCDIIAQIGVNMVNDRTIYILMLDNFVKSNPLKSMQHEQTHEL